MLAEAQKKAWNNIKKLDNLPSKMFHVKDLDCHKDYGEIIQEFKDVENHGLNTPWFIQNPKTNIREQLDAESCKKINKMDILRQKYDIKYTCELKDGKGTVNISGRKNSLYLKRPDLGKELKLEK